MVYSMSPDSLEMVLLTSMIRIRMIEEAIADRYSEQKMRCPVHLSIGQEAPAAAFSAVVEKGDYAVSTHRGHAHFLAKGSSLNAMIAEIYGKSTGCSKGRGGSMHLADKSIGFMGTSAIVGNSIPIGVGLGLAIQIQNVPKVSCVFLGEGATEEGVFYESASFAALRHLPVVFLCENNGYSVYSPLSVRQPAGRNLTYLASALGLNAVEVDGNDAIACFESIQGALGNARNGAGPQFVEFHTFRHREHCGPNDDDHLGYRAPGELGSWLEKDPIELLERKLSHQNTNLGVEVRAIRSQFAGEIALAFDAAEAAPYPDFDECMDDVYA